MRRIYGLILVGFAAATASACYHATINTGRQPNGTTIERPWAHSFIAGLVPPSVTETAAQCPNGVARVDTQLSFLNMVANIVTLGIYSPMTITVACAGGDDEDAPEDDAVVPANGAPGQALNDAAARSARTGQPVWVDFR